MAGIFKVVPKVGPLRAIDFKEPTTKTENMYFKSVDQTIDQYGKALQEVKSGDLQAPEMNLDTGKPTKRGEYPLADATYRELLDELAYEQFAHLNEPLRQNILNFYAGFGFPPAGTRIDKCVVQRWSKTWVELAQLRSFELLDQFDQPPAQAPPITSTASVEAAPASCGE